MTTYLSPGQLVYRGTNGPEHIIGRNESEQYYMYGWGDVVEANGGNDTVWGSDGDDRLYGNQGNDNLNGETGNDTIYGGDGNDNVDGGLGADQLYGGAGQDSFRFNAYDEGVNNGVKELRGDIIRDFQPGYDKIWLSIDANVNLGGVQKPIFLDDNQAWKAGGFKSSFDANKGMTVLTFFDGKEFSNLNIKVNSGEFANKEIWFKEGIDLLI